MARTVSQIYQTLLDAKDDETELSGLTSTSQTAIWRLLLYIQAVCIAVHEQLMDVLKTDIEDLVASAAPGTAKWVKAQVLKFQYSATTPQVIELVDYAPAYPTIDEDLQIITRCSVATDSNKVVLVKVAKSDPPAPLSALEQSALDGYLEDIMFAGVSYTIINADSDKLYVKADVYYNGQYASVIQASVEEAIEDFLANLEFNGYLKLSKLIDAIQAVDGVTDVVLEDVAMRRDTQSIGAAVYMVQGYDVLSRSRETYAGYIVSETTAGYTLTDSLNFIVEN